jgi:hypothetical protein
MLVPMIWVARGLTSASRSPMHSAMVEVPWPGQTLELAAGERHPPLADALPVPHRLT